MESNSEIGRKSMKNPFHHLGHQGDDDEPTEKRLKSKFNGSKSNKKCKSFKNKSKRILNNEEEVEEEESSSSSVHSSSNNQEQTSNNNTRRIGGSTIIGHFHQRLSLYCTIIVFIIGGVSIVVSSSSSSASSSSSTSLSSFIPDFLAGLQSDNDNNVNNVNNGGYDEYYDSHHHHHHGGRVKRSPAPQRPYVPTRPDPCDQSCYPHTGNLLIGRESNLTASSTCGQYREERFCVISHLEDKKKCFRCDSTDRHADNPLLSHRIKYIIHRMQPGTQTRTWWQSENGLENVSIRLDLEAEFHFTHLIMTFKTFRPAAMLIERSADGGKTWNIYRYFAYDCAHSFPGIPTGDQKNVSDVVCESRYSGVTPSTDGEFIFRALPKNLLGKINPYSEDVQNLLRITNLRINFTKLHTLGDDRLDKRQEITEKYYYAIYEMVVRGSCSCYGHASRCLPTDESAALYAAAQQQSSANQYYYGGGGGGNNNNVNAQLSDMVHGRCECTHNTKGANCEECEDFYHDVEWKPAIGKHTNACRRCNCNNHATRCHFDSRVFADSHNISGGYCDDCQHNTRGIHCEECADFYYLRDGYPISHEQACEACDCDPRGSANEGRCDSKTDPENDKVAGRCICKENVIGPRCDQCKKNHWNLDIGNALGCQQCRCDTKGTVEYQGCNMFTGSCTCKRYVTGSNCNQCLPEYWGLSSEVNGCKACDCDVGGAFNNNCDASNGTCSCRREIAERTCNVPKQGYYVPNMDHLLAEAELARNTTGNCLVVVREPLHDGSDSNWSGTGFMRCVENSVLEFSIDNVMTSMDYDLMIRYEPQLPGTWQQVTVTVIPDIPPDPEGPCANSISSESTKNVLLRSEAREGLRYPIEPLVATMYPPICLEGGRKYTIRLELTSHDRDPSSAMLIDAVVLLPRIDNIPFFHATTPNEYRKRQFEHYGCGEPYKTSSGSFAKHLQIPESIREDCKSILFSVGAYVFDGAFECGCNPAGSLSLICDPLGGQCKCKKNIVGRTCDRCAPGTYGFNEGTDGCTPCECDAVGSLDNFCDVKSGRCLCHENTYGQHCNECQTGFWRFPKCEHCNCNGHADTCDSFNGSCIQCEDFTTGHTCDRCLEGHYGDPRLGIDRPCKLCPCPGTSANHTFAKRCALDRYSDDVICECYEGYAGPRCDTCADNYYGYPERSKEEATNDIEKKLFGSCLPCSCNNNIDISRGGNCNSKTGECLQCLFNTEGDGCEVCKPGYYGDATQQSCRSCVCNMLGTNSSAGPCNNVNGYCPCLPNVIGISCDTCEVNHWKIASGVGCEPCDCDPKGAEDSQCDLYYGQCRCKDGFGGRKCDQCQETFWGDPELECYPCECNQLGSQTLQCDRTNGSCVCIEGIGGSKCDECARGHIGSALNCTSCGECFNNWDRILGLLSAQTNVVVQSASTIKQQGATGAYTREFEIMQTRIDEVQELLKSSSISSSDLKELGQSIEDQRYAYGNTSVALDAVTDVLANVSQKLLLTTVSLNELERKVESLTASSNSLKSSVINLQEGNVEGALNLTREAKARSDSAARRVEGVTNLLRDSKRQRERIEQLRSSISPQLNATQDELNDALDKLEDSLLAIESSFPSLNSIVCDRGGNPCDSYCGGAGCGSCGGLSCNDGAVSTSENALKFAQDAFTELKRKDADAEELLRAVMQTKEQVDEANSLAQIGFNEIHVAKNKSEDIKSTLEELENEIQEFLNTSAATPKEIRELAQEVISKNITLKPEQINELASGIKRSMTNLRNIDDILRATQNTLYEAENWKGRANSAAEQADKILQDAIQVRDELDKTSVAQTNAEVAIKKAGEFITEANLDLAQIRSETVDAENKSKESLRDANLLKQRLEALQRKNLENERMRLQVNKESESAVKNATEVQKQAARLNEEYGSVSKALDTKLRRFEGAKLKEEIQGRANHLASNVNEKLVELNEMEREYSENDRKTADMLIEIHKLTAQMELDYGEIRKIEEYHRTCNS